MEQFNSKPGSKPSGGGKKQDKNKLPALPTVSNTLPSALIAL